MSSNALIGGARKAKSRAGRSLAFLGLKPFGTFFLFVPGFINKKALNEFHSTLVFQPTPSFTERKGRDEIFDLLVRLGAGAQRTLNEKEGLGPAAPFLHQSLSMVRRTMQNLAPDGTVRRAGTPKTTNEFPEKRRGPLVAPGVNGCGPSKPDTLGR